jgi:hypothetical protein
MGLGELLEGTGRGVEGMVGGLERCLFCDEVTRGWLMRRAGLHGRWLPWVEGCARKLEFPESGLVFASTGSRNACHLARRRSGLIGGVSRLPVISLIAGCATSLPLRPLRSPDQNDLLFEKRSCY